TPPGPPCGREAGGRARPPDCRRPHDHGRVDSGSHAPVRQGAQSMSKIDGLPPEVQEEVMATAPEADIAVAPELMANSLGEYLRGAFARVRGGESGVLPVVGGLLLISILFQVLNSHFLTSG